MKTVTKRKQNRRMANKGTVLLQTARTTATNSDGSRSLRVRILFDSGSQRSYISNRLKTTLKLKPVKSETLNLNTFGNSKFRKQNCDLVELNLEDKDQAKVTIKAPSFPVICSSLPSRINVEEFSHLDELELADDIEHDGNEEIDYWTVVTGEMKKGESGPVAVSSKLGWLLSSPLNDSATPTDVQSNLIISGKSEINYIKKVLGNYGKPFWTKAVEFFSDGREFSRTVENFLGQSRFFSDGREFSRTVDNFLGQSRFFSDGREFSRTVDNFLGRSRIFSDGREFSRTVEIFLGRSRFFSDGRDFSWTVENFLGRSRIFSDGREFSRTVENFLGRSRFFSDGRDFSRTVEIFLDGRDFSRTGRDFSRTVEIFLGRSRIFSDGRDFKFFSVGRDFRSNSPASPSV